MATAPHPHTSVHLLDIGNCVHCSQVVSDHEQGMFKEISEFASFDGFSDIIASLISKRLELVVNSAVQHGIEIGKQAQQTHDAEDVERYRTAYLSVRDQLAQALKPKDGTEQLQDGNLDQSEAEELQIRSFNIAPLSLSSRSNNHTTPPSSSTPSMHDSPVSVIDHFVYSESLGIKFLLNQLTMTNFEYISDLIITRINDVCATQDDKTFTAIVHHIYKAAVNGTKYTDVYAHLCRKVMERINIEIKDDNATNKPGGLVSGGQLFRRYLLNMCQNDFERNLDNTSLRSDEIGCRQYLGVAKLIGELYRVQMLTERIVHECIKRVLVETWDDVKGFDSIESLCVLLSSIGEALDTPKASAHFDVYFRRMSDIVSVATPNTLSNRLRFMVLDIIELRKRNWVPRRATATPWTRLGSLSTGSVDDTPSTGYYLKSEGTMDGRA